MVIHNRIKVENLEIERHLVRPLGEALACETPQNTHMKLHLLTSYTHNDMTESMVIHNRIKVEILEIERHLVRPLGEALACGTPKTTHMKRQNLS